ncbi:MULTISPECIES: hypothetical protein [unclassified Mesorhizobium]|uniref:hypothetical protein n=1 Tax=unclassified Mesorhizobium TaxID=325217 RepID=UPI000FDCD9BF|nr:MULTISPECIES: hypothetical protein [unclassified Mesorhizobium]TGQ47621.1 hypothetical protein EN859_000060 [Mesorhizobium sp. M00.F.Ca.ET.216.01.1.1]TIS87234.1 MAG: hypothetical protein E5W89_25990 [Mesorhizobium sp.]
MSWVSLLSFLQSGAVVAAILAAVLAGFGFPLKIWIQSSVSHRFNRKLEALRNGLSRNSSRLDALQSSSLSMMSARQSALDTKRLQGIQSLWSATVDQRRFNAAVRMLQRLNVPEIAKSMEQGGPDRDKIKEFGAGLFSVSGLENAPQADAPKPDYDRLFVPPAAWAAFEALRSTNMQAVVILASMKTGAGPSLVFDSANVNSLILLALPHMADFLANRSDSGAFFLTDALESAIFDHLTTALKFADADSEMIEKVSYIASRIENHKINIPDEIPDRYKSAESLEAPKR